MAKPAFLYVSDEMFIDEEYEKRDRFVAANNISSISTQCSFRQCGTRLLYADGSEENLIHVNIDRGQIARTHDFIAHQIQKLTGDRLLPTRTISTEDADFHQHLNAEHIQGYLCDVVDSERYLYVFSKSVDLISVHDECAQDCIMTSFPEGEDTICISLAKKFTLVARKNTLSAIWRENNSPVALFSDASGARSLDLFNSKKVDARNAINGLKTMRRSWIGLSAESFDFYAAPGVLSGFNVTEDSLTPVFRNKALAEDGKPGFHLKTNKDRARVADFLNEFRIV